MWQVTGCRVGRHHHWTQVLWTSHHQGRPSLLTFALKVFSIIGKSSLTTSFNLNPDQRVVLTREQRWPVLTVSCSTMQSGLSGLQSSLQTHSSPPHNWQWTAETRCWIGRNQTADVSINDLYTSGVWSWSVTFLKLAGNRSYFALRHQMRLIWSLLCVTLLFLMMRDKSINQ